MKALIISAWAWAVAHPAESLGALYALLNAVNAAIPVERRKASVWLRVLDRICFATQRGAINASSWPLAGRSIAKEVASAVIAERETQAPPPPSEPGYAEQWVLGAIALAAVAALALSGCAAAQSPSLSPISPHLVERPEYGTCAETGGKLEVPQAGTVALLTSVCWMRADAGVAVDAAPEPVIVVPEKGDAGAVE